VPSRSPASTGESAGGAKHASVHYEFLAGLA
jgi:hypothetical protein